MARFTALILSLWITGLLGLFGDSGAAEEALQHAQTIAVGLWPEGVVTDGTTAWVAESGQRRLARVDLRSGKVTARVPVGRLPVHVVRGPDGMLYSLVHTEKKIMAIHPRTDKVTVVANLPDCPQQMVYADGALWVLLWQDCSSINATVLRLDLASRRQWRSGPVGRDAWSLAVGYGRVWVAHGQGTVSVLEAQSLVSQPRLQAGSWHRHIVAGSAALFTDDAGGGVLRLDPHTGQVAQSTVLGEVLTGLTWAADTVIALGQQGTIWLLDPATLTVRAQRQAAPELQTLRFAVLHGTTLLVTAHAGRGTHGSLVVLRW